MENSIWIIISSLAQLLLVVVTVLLIFSNKISNHFYYPKIIIKSRLIITKQNNLMIARMKIKNCGESSANTVQAYAKSINDKSLFNYPLRWTHLGDMVNTMVENKFYYLDLCEVVKMDDGNCRIRLASNIESPSNHDLVDLKKGENKIVIGFVAENMKEKTCEVNVFWNGGWENNSLNLEIIS